MNHHLLLLAVFVPVACCSHLPLSASGRHRQTHHWPRHAVANNDNQNNDNEIDSTRLRHALQQLLKLNDGELQALMLGMSPRAVAPRIEPSTAFLLASSRQYLERLNTILSTVEDTSPVKKSTWNPKIARRHKKERSSHKNGFEAQLSAEQTSEEDPDSILGALTELSAYLSGAEEEEEEEQDNYATQQQRKRRSHHQGRGRSHQTFQTHDSTKYETHHYLYYLRSGECPRSGDGTPKMYCPSPSESGEWICIEDLELCDDKPQCPNKEDEAPTHCLFHNAMRNHVDELTKYIVLSKFS